MRLPARIHRSSRGLTLIELCVGLGIVAVLVSQAMPAMTRMLQERALRVHAEALASDLRFARSEAARMNDSVYFRVSDKGANACYVLHTGARNDCDCAGGKAVCKTPGSEIIKAEWLPHGLPLTLRSNAETLEFQHRQGLVTQTGSIELKLAGGSGVTHVIAITGRVRSCYTGAGISGMKKCA